MFSHKVNKSFIVDDSHAIDQRSVIQAPGRNIRAKDIKRKFFHPTGNFISVGSVCHCRIYTVLYQQDRTPGFRDPQAAIQ